MDIENIYLVVGAVGASAAILFVMVYLFKNKSYDEVLAEQRQQNNALFASQHRPKLKDKKQKKAVKKVKEKKAPVSEVSEESENAEPELHKHHVEFKEATVIEENVKAESKRKSKKETVRPILVNHDLSPETIQDNGEVLLANHFEESHPKDDFELMNSQTQNEECAKEKKTKKAEPEHKPKKQSKQQSAEPPKVVEVVEKKEETPIEAVIVAPVQIPVQANGIPAKEKKKKKNEYNMSAHLSGDKLGVGLTDLLPLVRKAEMSKVEVQILIDMLLNKQQDAPVVDDWSEGKGDPVQKLKKQLADKEKQVQELQDTLTGTQAKLREIRAEQNVERSHLLQNVRELEEGVKVSKLERQSTENKIQNMTLKFQQMQEQYNDEAVKARKIMDEYSNLKMQTQQMEIHIAQLQEAELTIAQLRNELQELQSRRTIESHAAIEHNMLVKQLQHQVATFKEDIDKKEARLRELKDMNTSMEQRMSAILRQEDDMKNENSQLKSEIQRSLEEARRFEHNKTQEAQLLRKGKEDAEQNQLKLNSEFKLIKTELMKLESEKKLSSEDNVRLNMEIVLVKEENANLHNEKSKWTEERKALQEEKRLLQTERSLQQAKTNGALEKDRQLETELEELKETLTKANLQFQQFKEIHDRELQKLEAQHRLEMDEQRNKNNELRQKNWKVVEALNAAETRCKSIESRGKFDNKTKSSATQADVTSSRTAFVQSLLASCKELEELPEEKCGELLATFARDYVNGPTKTEDVTEVSKLRVQVDDYQKIIDETEGILSKLQMHIKDEEIRWRSELKNKDECILELKALIKASSNEKNSIGDVVDVSDDTSEAQNHYMNGPDSALYNSSGM